MGTERDPIKHIVELRSAYGLDPMLLTRPLVVGEEEMAFIEASIKLIAMTVAGLEKAVGVQTSRVLGNIMGLELYKMRSGLFKSLGLKEALEALNRSSFRIDVYRMRGRLVHTDPQTGRKAFYFVGRECPIRQILYHEDLPAGRALCRITCSFLEALLKEKLGGRYRVGLVRYGPNACFMRAEILEGPEPPEDLEVYSVKPSLKEYIPLLVDDLRDILLAFDRTVERVLGGNPSMSYVAGKGYGTLDGENLLTYLGRPVPLDEALDVINKVYDPILRLRREGGDTLVVEKSLYHELAAKYNLEKSIFIYRTVQGYIAGLLSVLTGQRVDLRALDDKATRLKIYTR